MKIGNFILGIIFTVFLWPSISLAATPSIPSLYPVNQEKLLVTGVTTKNTEVTVYIDNNFIGLASVNSGRAQTDNFSFSVQGLLKPGEHIVKVAAKDIKTLSLSGFSGQEKFNVLEDNSVKPKITKIAASEGVKEEAKNSKIDKQNENYFSDKYQVTDKTEEQDKKLNEKILRWNLAIFLFFLIAVITWIIWVNKELKQEKVELEKKSAISEKDDPKL